MSITQSPADHGVLDLGGRLVNVVAPLVPEPQATRSLLPAERPLRHPPAAAQILAALDIPAAYPRRDPALPENLYKTLR